MKNHLLSTIAIIITIIIALVGVEIFSQEKEQKITHRTTVNHTARNNINNKNNAVTNKQVNYNAKTLTISASHSIQTEITEKALSKSPQSKEQRLPEQAKSENQNIKPEKQKILLQNDITETPREYSLHSIIKNSTGNLAAISLTTNKSESLKLKIFTEGQQLDKMWSIQSIDDNGVVLQSKEQNEMWLYPENINTIDQQYIEYSMNHPDYKTLEIDYPEIIEHVTFDTDIDLNKSMASYRMIASIGLSPVDDFETKGYELTLNDSNMHLSELALQDGDKLLEINSHLLGDPNSDIDAIALEIMTAESNQQDLILIIERQGTQKELIIDFRKSRSLL